MESPTMIEQRKQNGNDVDSSCGDIASDNGDVSFREGGHHSDESTDEHVRKRVAASNLGFSENEQKIVNYGRFAFLFCLLSSAAALAVTVYYIGQRDEEQDFKGEFHGFADDIIEVSDNNIQRIVNMMHSLSLLATSFLIAEHKANPSLGKGFVTIPDIEEHFGTARKNSGALVIAYVPEVPPSDAEAWNQYTKDKQGWVQSSLGSVNVTDSVWPSIWEVPSEGGAQALAELESTCSALGSRTHLSDDARADRISVEPNTDPFSPVWTFSPPPLPDDLSIVNYNLRVRPAFQNAVNYIAITKQPTFLDVCDQSASLNNQEHTESLQTAVVFPVFAQYDKESSDVVGHLVAVIPWEVFFQDILLDDAPPLRAVVENTCNEVFTLEIKGHDATFLAEEDLHDKTFTDMAIKRSFASIHDDVEDHDHKRRSQEIDSQTCQYTLTIYPTKAMHCDNITKNPVIFAVVVVGVFFITSVLFIIFDCYVRKRTEKVMNVALKQNAIVSSLFPKNVQIKMMAEADENDKLGKVGRAGIKSFLNSDKQPGTVEKEALVSTKPIADLFPATTIMFADMAGFTAWSSAREPSQVFTLLESIYSEFDRIAHRRKVFKVEVIGDCYVAVSGLPNPRKDHAVIMAKFAMDCLAVMNQVTERLVLDLGPDTNNLKLRIGLHSGPVVAGVLRGDKSRFQLFGDTMTTANLMESSGIPNRIHLSQETADLLIADGRKSWLAQDTEIISVNGKGEMVTYFLGNVANGDTRSKLSESSKDYTGQCLNGSTFEAGGFNRITEWTVEVMTCLLKQIVMSRNAAGTPRTPRTRLAILERQVSLRNEDGKHTVIDEVQEIIELPDFQAKTAKTKTTRDVALDPKVLCELRDYIRTIAILYNANPFHNFEHANHVTMSVVKLLSRIVAPDIEDVGNKSLDDHTYGITADPLTRFAVVFSALIHDVDHSGVSNVQLVKEGSTLATLYKNKSVAEQNSVDLCWDLLMEPQYENLRDAIYSTSAEFYRFRSLVVNAVMATDIMDKDLKKLRNDRWDIAFDSKQDQVCKSAINRKATIVIEHLLQASDVAHTMQHWHVYRKWNERLFQEMYRAYEGGRLETDPSESWYQGEIGFFDFYIIPLAKKLKDCGVFGVSSDEYLSYALQNRKEWERRGKTIVEEMVQAVKQQVTK